MTAKEKHALVENEAELLGGKLAGLLGEPVLFGLVVTGRKTKTSFICAGGDDLDLPAKKRVARCLRELAGHLDGAQA